MQHLFVIPASTRLFDAIANVRPLVDSDPKLFRPICKEIGINYVDDVVDGLVLGFIHESATISPRSRSLIETLAKLIKSVAHGLVGQAFGNLNNERARLLLVFLDERAATFEGGPGLGVPITAETFARITEAMNAIGSSDLEPRRALLKTTMRDVISKALELHYQKPFSILDLGFILRKAVDVGYDSILRGAISTIETSISDGDEQQLSDLARFLGRRAASV